MTDPQVTLDDPEVDPQGTPSEPVPTAEPFQEPAGKPVDPADLAAEDAASKPRNTDELGLDTDQRAEVEAYVSRQINDARQKWDKKVKESDTYLTKDEVETMMTQQRVEQERRSEARESFVKNLAKSGVAVGSPEYDQVGSWYSKALEDGLVTPNILHGEDNVKLLAQMAGVLDSAGSKGGSAGPGRGLPKNAPEGAIYHNGEIQLNVGAKEGAELTMDQKVEAAMMQGFRDGHL